MSLHLPVVKPEIICTVSIIVSVYDTKRVTVIVIMWDQLMIPPTLKIMDEKFVS